MKVWIVVLAVLAIGIVYTGRNSDASEGGASSGGSDAVYAHIEAMTDCEQLQGQFDQAEYRHERELDSGDSDGARKATDYMRFIDGRMDEIGCYG